MTQIRKVRLVVDRPTFLAQMPVHHRERNDILQTLELARNERTVGLEPPLCQKSDSFLFLNRPRISHRDGSGKR